MAHLGRTLAAGVTAVVTAGALAAPASAGGGDGHGGHHGGGVTLTRSAASTLDRFDIDLDVVGGRHHGAHRGGGVALRGTLVFDGAATVKWRKIRVNERANRVTAIVGGERRPVLRFRDGTRHKATVLRLTRAGAASIDRAAKADAFDAGDSFAKVRRH